MASHLDSSVTPAGAGALALDPTGDGRTNNDGLTPAPDARELHDAVRARYAAAAISVLDGRVASCCDPGTCGCAAPAGGGQANVAPAFEVDARGTHDYGAADRAALPEAAVLASLGCGNPIAVAELREGETVLDLGSGGGIDVLLSARRVGPTGRAIGLDMTPEMLELARANAAEAGAENVAFLEGTIEAIPLADATVDVVISNCVVNLAADKPAVFREIARVLRPGGRIGISDIVAADRLTPAERLERGSYVGCIAGALSFAEYERGLRDAGLERIEIVPTHEVADGMVSAIVRAVRPG